MRQPCGCGSLGTVLEEGPGIDITGAGTPVNPATVAAQISRQPGNVLQIGGDQGLYVPSGAPGTPPPQWVTVDTLPTGPNSIMCGYRGCGRAIGPDHLQRSYQRAVGWGLPMAHMDVRALADGTLLATAASFVSELATGAPYTSDLNGLERQTGARLSTVLMDVCDSGLIPSNPASGWWGFLEPNQFGFPTVAELFGEVGGRIVLFCDLNEWTNAPRDAGPLLLEMIHRYGLERSVIVSSVFREKLFPFREAGIATALTTPTEDWAAANPPAELIADGIPWVWVNKFLSDETISGYSSAGLSVIVSLINRHVERPRMANVGARALMADDPMYASADPARYKRPDGLVTYGAKTIELGQLTRSIDFSRYATTAGTMYPDARGFYSAGRDGLTIPQSPDPVIYPSQAMSILVGSLCPITEPSYRIGFSVRFDSSAGSAARGLGLAFCWLTDDVVMDDSGATEKGYLATLSFSGVMRIFKKNAGPGVLVGNAISLGTQTVGAWIDLTIKVTPSELRLYRTADEGTPAQHAVGAEAEFRGGYISLVKFEVSGAHEASFKNVRVLVP